MRHIICFSKGHSSALTAIEVVRRFGNENVILLNHDINPRYEHPDIKRFGNDVAEYLGLPITYANFADINDPTKLLSQFSVCMLARAFKVGNGQALCSDRLKLNPFRKWLKINGRPGNDVIYYGFDANEQHRAIRTENTLKIQGYRTDYPLINWKCTISSTEEIGIKPPLTYSIFKHANCIGCLKAGKQHWYIVYCLYPDIWEEAKEAEEYIGYTIHDGESLDELEPKFKQMKEIGIVPTEKVSHQKFWADVNKKLKFGNVDNSKNLPCECSF
jgi:hypothetical protein